MCATMPSPKKVSTRCRVRSKNWFGITKSSGLCSSFSDPTAETEIMRSTPNCLKPKMLARKFSSLGKIVCPRAWRARNATWWPPSVPRMYASEGSPNGVCCWTSRASANPGIWYRPLPPIMPISACFKCAPAGAGRTFMGRTLNVMTAEPDYTRRELTADRARLCLAVFLPARSLLPPASWSRHPDSR